MPDFNQKGIVHVLVLIVLLFGLVASLYLVSHPAIFKPKAAAPANQFSKNILLLIYNPILKSKANQRLTTFQKWNDPKLISQQLVDTFSTVSGGIVSYNIVETKELDDYPVKTDGFKYTEQAYLDCASSGGSKCHSPDGADYVKMLNTVDACNKRNSGQIDEVWIWGGPWFGYFESNMAGPNAFYLNSGPTTGSTCTKVLPIMGFNYAAGLDNAIHDFGHRTESTMSKVYGDWQENRTQYNFDKFGLDKAQSPSYNYSGCGSIHYPPNSVNGYDYSNTSSVNSNCDDFYNYPNLSDPTQVLKPVTCSVWGCNQAGYLKWWFSHLPKAPGVGPDGKLNNWWAYMVDPEKNITNTNPSTRSDKLISYWKMDEESGNSVVDSLNLNFGTAFGNTKIVTSKTGFGKARNFDGSKGTKVDLGDKTPFEATTLSISAWVNRVGNCNAFKDCNVFSKGQSGNVGYALRVKSYDGGKSYKASFSIRDSRQDVKSASLIDANKWYHLVATYDGSKINLYVNGKLESQVPQTVVPIFGSESAVIGNGNTGVDLGFSGIIDEVAVWNRVLSDHEVANIYNSGNGQDILLLSSVPNPTPSPIVTPIPSPAPVGHSCTACGADVNKDGYVTGQDVSYFRGCSGKSPNATSSAGLSCKNADVNGDGLIDNTDLNCISSKAFGDGCPSNVKLSPNN